MKRGLFKRIFLLYGAILLLAVFGAEQYITGTVREDRIGALRGSLTVQAELMARDVPFRSRTSLDGLCRQLKEKTGTRVTFISPDGVVQGDSDHDSSTMENHRDRVEIQQAALTGAGMAIRHSHTLGYDLLYVAKKIGPEAAPSGFIRLSIPLADVDASVNRLRGRIIAAVSAILLATGLFSFWQLDRLRRFTVQVRDFALGVAKGDLDKRLFLGRAGEFDEIARSLNVMSAELRQTIAAGEEEKRRLSVILRNIPDALLITDASDVIRISNTTARMFFGEAAQPGNQLIEAVRNRDFLALIDEVRRSNTAGVAEFRVDLPEERFFAARVAPLSYAAGEISGHVALFHDITRLVRLEQTRKDFVANISHELKTPITAIQGFAETLLEGALEDADHARSFIETIRGNSRRINGLVDDLMTISKLELGAITVSKSPVDLGDAVETVLAIMRPKAEQKGLSLTAAIPKDLGTILADGDRLAQILTNLVDNAIKFTEKGGVVIGAAGGKDSTFLYVEDTGIGIPERHLPRLGERFYRVDAARSRQMGGTGLGLAIVKHLVKAHGWDMRIESTGGKGTKVRIFIG